MSTFPKVLGYPIEGPLDINLEALIPEARTEKFII